MTVLETAFVLAAIGLAFVLSASAGLGGSLVLVPALAFSMGAKQGTALAALLLASNNIVKLAAYRRTVPWRKSVVIIAATIAGAWIGARLLVAAPEALVTIAVIVSFSMALLVERVGPADPHPAFAGVYATGSGLTSGFSGTSGPLKGVALRTLHLDRRHFVGAASVVSLAGDAAKSAVYAEAGLLDGHSWTMAATAIPVMIGATLLGRQLNNRIGERGYTIMFWSVMSGYTARLVGVL